MLQCTSLYWIIYLCTVWVKGYAICCIYNYNSVGGAPEAYGSLFVCVCVILSVTSILPPLLKTKH